MTLRGLALLVGDVDAVGGSERQALLLARTLVARGVPVVLLTTTWAPRRWTETRDGVRIVRTPLPMFEATAGALLCARRDAVAGLYGVGLMMGAIAARVGRAVDLPVVVKLAGAGPGGDMAALARLPAGDHATVLADLRATHVVCVTDELAREAVAGGLSSTRLVRLPNGVDLTTLRGAAPVRPGGDAPTVLFLGRLDPWKGADVLVRAFPAVASAVPGARLLIAGDGPERTALERLVAEQSLGDAVMFLGRRDDPWDLLAGATVTCVPSRTEGMSNVLLEALGLGAPIVASSIPANLEVIAGSGAALLVPAADPSSLAAALSRALLDDALRAALSAAGRARAADFSIDAVAAAHEQLFERLGPIAHRGRFELVRRFVGARLDDVSRVLRRAVG